eukprot:2921570-Pleurochrysis_carterae.AAC.2
METPASERASEKVLPTRHPHKADFRQEGWRGRVERTGGRGGGGPDAPRQGGGSIGDLLPPNRPKDHHSDRHPGSARRPVTWRPLEPVGRWAPIAPSSGAVPTLFGEGRQASPGHGRFPAKELV